MKIDRMDKFTSHISYAWCSLFATFGALSRDEWAFLIGVGTALLTCAINWWYKRRDAIHKEKVRERYYAAHKKDSENCDL
ncbi:phage holin [Orbus wheelerorum]|uniref:HP1 family phage holin n=1 Tax=Orbus wheelerorum TaxID=3074111 RepID=UPI00370D21EE